MSDVLSIASRHVTDVRQNWLCHRVVLDICIIVSFIICDFLSGHFWMFSNTFLMVDLGKDNEILGVLRDVWN